MAEKYGFIYLWYDRKHKRYYVGSHWGTEDDGYICSSSWMKKAQKYRSEDFKRRILTIVVTRANLLAEEQKWLDMIKPEEVKVRYYNLHLNCMGLWHHSDEPRKTIGEKISVSKIGKSNGAHTEETRKKMSEVKLKRAAERLEKTGSKFTDEHRAKIAESKTGLVQTDEHKEKISQGLKEAYASGARVVSDEYREKMSKLHYGKIVSQETRDKISASSKVTKEQRQIKLSKRYIITYNDGSIEEVLGLKAYAAINNIPYVTLNKAFQNKTPSPKYLIKSIALTS